MAKDFSHDGSEYRGRIVSFSVDAENEIIEVRGEVVDRNLDRLTKRFRIDLAGDDFINVVTAPANAGEMVVDVCRRVLWDVIGTGYLTSLLGLDDSADTASVTVTEQPSLRVNSIKARKLAATTAVPVADTEFPDGDTPYSRAIALADFQSLALTLHKRGEPNPSERIQFTAHELLHATKTGWTTWQETAPDGKVSNVMMKGDGMFGNPNGWVEVLVKSRTDGPVLWLEISDSNWGTVVNVEVVHG